MFPGCEIALKFSLGKTKNRYTVLCAIFPKFKKTLIYDIIKSPVYIISNYQSSNMLNECWCQVSEWKEKPIINWNVLDILDDDLIEVNLSKTVHIGSCAKRIVHGTLKEASLKS